MTRPRKNPGARDSNSGSSALEADALPLGQRGGREHESKVRPYIREDREGCSFVITLDTSCNF